MALYFDLELGTAGMSVMWPLIEISLQAKFAQDHQNLELAIEQFSANDPSIRTRVGRYTGELLLGCDSEQELDRTLAMLAQNDRIQVDVGRRRAAYRETITRLIEYVYTRKKQTGGSGEYAQLTVILEPKAPGEGFEFVDETNDGAIPSSFIPSIESALNAQKEEGALIGEPVIDFRVRLVDGKYHDVDSNAQIFEIAAAACLREALRQAGPIILEPVMKVEVVTPDDTLENVIEDIKRRRGRVVDRLKQGTAIAVEAIVPLSETFGYIDQLSDMTGGRASLSMRYDRYEAVPILLPPHDNFPPAVGIRAVA